jgi:putative spermidine/putrescine transport system ATP-binding protein
MPINGRKNVRMKVETIVNYGDNALVIGSVGTQPMRVLGADVVIIKENDECTISWTPDAVYVIAA